MLVSVDGCWSALGGVGWCWLVLVGVGGCWWVLVGVGGEMVASAAGFQKAMISRKLHSRFPFVKEVRIVVKVMVLQPFHKNSVFRLRMRVRWNSCQEDQLNCCVYKHLRAGRGNTIFVHKL